MPLYKFFSSLFQCCKLLFCKSEIWNPVKWNIYLDCLSAGVFLSVIRNPSAFRKDDFTLTSRIHHRSHENVRAYHELVLHARESLVREMKFERCHYRLTRLGSPDYQRLDFRQKFFPDLHRLEHCIEMFLVENAPRSHGELHHRHKRMSLCRADDEVLIYLASRKERSEAAASDHVRTGIPVTHKVGRHHLRNEDLDRFPVVSLVMKTLHDGLSAVTPRSTVFIVRILVGIVSKCLAILVGLQIAHCTGILREEVEVAGIELESIYAIILAEIVKLPVEPLDSLRIGKVELGRIAVPPLHRIDSRAFFPTNPPKELISAQI